MINNAVKMSESEYRARPELNSSTLQMCMKDPRMFAAEKLSFWKYDSDSMQLGRALHVRYLLGVNEFFNTYWEKKTRKNSKAFIEEEEVAGGKEMLSSIMFEKILRMGKIAEESKIIPKRALKEVCFFATVHRMKFKCRVDAIAENDDGTLTIYDYKTTREEVPGRGHHNVLQFYGGCLQADLYKRIVEKSTEKTISSFIHILHSTSPPHLLDIVELGSTVFHEGGSRLLRGINAYRESQSMLRTAERVKNTKWLSRVLPPAVIDGYSCD